MARQRGGAAILCQQCGGVTRVRRTFRDGAHDGIVIRERLCANDGTHRYYSCEHVVGPVEAFYVLYDADGAPVGLDPPHPCGESDV